MELLLCVLLFVSQEHEVQDGVKLKVKLGRGLDKTTHVIHEVDPSDEGRYFCRAFNTLGSKETHADIRLMSMFYRFLFLFTIVASGITY